MEKFLNEKKQYFDLTIPQENIWLTEQLNPNTTINNVFGTFFINKSLNIDILKKAINKIIENNDALRIRIDEINSKPYQYIADYEFDELPVYFLDNDDNEKIYNIIDTIGLEHINILNNKLYDLRIISTPNCTCICIKMHHIIADAWSMGQIFIENIKKYYIEIEENRIFDYKTSYIDYIKRNSEYKLSNKYVNDLQFWQKYVKNISYENQFEIVKYKKSNRIVKSIDETLANKIKIFCEQNNISEFALLLSVISIYFSKIFDINNIVIGTPFLNRQKIHKELDIMGMFVATLPISVNVKPNMTFIDLCKQVTSTNISCFKHSRFPYSEIQKEYANTTGQNTNLYEIAFSYQINNLEQSFDSSIYKTTWQPNNIQTNPLIISYINHFGEHELCYDYILELLDSETINNIHQRLLIIINQILKKPEVEIEKINILSEDDINILQKFNNTGDIKLENETIISRFQKIVEKNKSKTAIKFNNTEITYKELEEKSNSVANNIIKQKIKTGSPIALILDKSPEMIIAMLGVLKSGCYYIPILPEEEQERAEYIIKNSEACLLITEEKYSTKISSNVIEKKSIISDLITENTDNPNINIKPTDLSYFIYTSGSTGEPKGVMLKHENVISLIISMNAHSDLKFLKNDISISLLKYSFDASAIDIYTMLLNGGKLIIVPKSFEHDPNYVTKLIETEKVTRFFTVSKWIEQIQDIAKNKKLDLSTLRLIGTGAEVLKPEKFKYLYEKYPNLKFCNTYGPTESTILVTSHLVNKLDIENNYSPIGTPIPYSRMLVLSHNKNEVLPINSKGELVIFEDETSIHNISNGYFKLEEKTKNHFIKITNPYTHKIVKAYKTGDYVKINKNLELEFLGRKDDFKKVNGGYLVSIAEVEKRIQNIIGNSINASVISIPFRNVNSIILFICKKSNSINISIDDIKNEIEKNLTFYMRPKQIIEIATLPYTKNGKVDKRLLQNQAEQYFSKKNDIILPTNKTEQMIYDIIHDIVKFDFSITDDFEDDLGIDSLNITILYSKLNNSKISIQDLYNYPTVKDLAYLIKKELSSETKIDTEPIKIINTANIMDLSQIFLTGTTGFVGIHLLKELTNNEKVQKIYCLVRQKLNSSGRERFEKQIEQYFDEETCQKIKQKAVVIEGDLRKEKLGLEENVYNRIFKNITTIINSAANVKHIGKYHTSYVDNVETVFNLIKICLQFNISLAHISTLSLNGYNNENVNEIFTENTLNINQTFNKNPYLISKFEAEQLILQNIINNGLNAKIFRVGNMMPRIFDGKFQINYDQNGFLLAISTLSKLQIFTEEIDNKKICLTPVDDCSKAICEILKSDYCNTIYHIENNQKIKISSFINIFNERNIQFSNVPLKTFEKRIMNDYSIGTEYLKSFLATNSNKYSSDITFEILEKLNFKWNPIKKDYLENIINISMKIKK